MAKVKTRRGRMSKSEIDFVLNHTNFGVEKLVKETGRSSVAIQRILDSIVKEEPANEVVHTSNRNKSAIKKDLTGHRRGATVMTPAASDNYDTARKQERIIPRNTDDYLRPAKNE